MQGVPSDYALTSIESSYLYHILDEEYKGARLSRPARIFFALFEGTSYVLPLVVGLACLLEILGPRFTPEAQRLADDLTARLGGVVLPVLAALAALSIINLPLVGKVYRQWLLSRRLTALKLLDAARFPRRHLGLKLLALVVPLGLLLLFLSSAIPPAEPLDGRRITAFVLLVLLPGALFLADELFRRLRDRIRYVEEVLALRDEVGTVAGRDEGPPLPPEVLARIADVERARVLRGRADAIRSGSATAGTSYAVRKSEEFSATLRKLDAGERMTLERAILDLAARQETLGGASKLEPPSTLHVEGTPWQLVYEVDTATRTLHMIFIRHQKDDAS